MSVALRRLLENPLFESLLLLQAGTRADSFSDEARARMRPWVDAAQSRFRVALELRDAETRPAVLSLLRESAFLALCALDAAQERALPATPAEAWERFDASRTDAPVELESVRAFLASTDPLAADALQPARAAESRSAAELVVEWLLSLVEVRTHAQLTRARVLRCALFFAAAVLVVGALVSYWTMLNELASRGG